MGVGLYKTKIPASKWPKKTFFLTKGEHSRSSALRNRFFDVPRCPKHLGRKTCSWDRGERITTLHAEVLTGNTSFYFLPLVPLASIQAVKRLERYSNLTGDFNQSTHPQFVLLNGIMGSSSLDRPIGQLRSPVTMAK